MKDIIIIGAGAAGLMTAVTLLEWWEEKDFHIHLFEKNTSPGKKVIISGGGRCNITTGNSDKKLLETKYTRGWDFIEKSMWKFWPKKVYEWFESHNIPLKIEEDMRVFPVSDNGRDVVGIFEKIFEKHRSKISLHYGEGVSHVSPSDVSSSCKDLSLPQIWDAFSMTGKTDTDPHFSQWQNQSAQFTVTTTKWTYEWDSLIITTGGNAYSHTGSTGDGYSFARGLGHTITPLWPSLSSFLTRETWTHELSGLAFESARVQTTLSSRGATDLLDTVHSLSWPLLLTHFGISWPLTFMLSSRLAFEKIEKEDPKEIKFSPIALMKKKEWSDFLKTYFLLHPKKVIINILSEKLPKRFAEWFIHTYFSHLETIFASSIGREDREHIALLLGEWIPMTLLERRPGDEFVTAGWVYTDEIDRETMESKIQKNLYFAWEILDVDGYTWGYSLQICWSSGYTVWKSVLESM